MIATGHCDFFHFWIYKNISAIYLQMPDWFLSAIEMEITTTCHNKRKCLLFNKLSVMRLVNNKKAIKLLAFFKLHSPLTESQSPEITS